MKKIILVLLMITLFFSIYAAGGYELQATSDQKLYAAIENKPIDQWIIIKEIKKGEVLYSQGCYSTKDDVYISVKTKDNKYGYLYYFSYVSRKLYIPSFSDLKEFLKKPYEKLECVIMISQFSKEV